MISRSKALAIAVALSVGSIANASTNLLVNGGFEMDSTFVPNSDDSMSLLPGSNALQGWNIQNTAGMDVAWLGPNNPWLPSSEGKYFVDLAGYHGSTPWSGLSQSFATVPGQSYTVSFDLGHWGTSPSILRASAGNVANTFTTNIGTTQLWDHETFTFKANSNSTLLTLQGLSASNGNYLAVDNVAAIAAVPEPETYAMMLVGLGFFAVARRKQWSMR